MTDENPNQDNTKKDLELLTCSAGDYAASQERSLSAYTMIGINSWNRRDDGNSLDCIKKRAILQGCEAVVDLRAHYAGSTYHEGTGMKLKQEKP